MSVPVYVHSIHWKQRTRH